MRCTAIFMSLLTMAGLISGCSILNPTPAPEPQMPAAQTQSEKFIESETKSATAVENAIMWSEKYAKLSDEMEKAQKKNLDLSEENRTLSNQLTEAQMQLEQAKKELAEANTLLVDMQKELTNWKTDVLGFRDEMRKAQKAQIDALTHIIILLGGETPSPAMDANTARHAESKTDEPNKSN